MPFAKFHKWFRQTCAISIFNSFGQLAQFSWSGNSRSQTEKTRISFLRSFFLSRAHELFLQICSKYWFPILNRPFYSRLTWQGKMGLPSEETLFTHRCFFREHSLRVGNFEVLSMDFCVGAGACSDVSIVFVLLFVVLLTLFVVLITLVFFLDLFCIFVGRWLFQSPLSCSNRKGRAGGRWGTCPLFRGGWTR